MARLILFSGGAESVAMTYLMAAPDDALLYVKPATHSHLFSNPARRAAQALARPLTEVHGHEVPGHQLKWLLPTAGEYAAARGLTEVWYGLYAGELDDPGKAAMYEAEVSTFGAKYPGIPVRWPLFHMSKREQIAALPAAVRDAINSCASASKCGHCFKCKELAGAL